ncbi:integrin-alpha FG-GAP repeat-containing protein 2-like [Plakobranchus ocellatus]|uniref:Integrin-alpha FG-GAP repeat-containing protein 2-like n=1 Tax=Plakobranchus ocellatus TaxID=259542 RepID=A0AAV4E4F8_9GAST|nr:integrin-alpha FG-GAP repeat-containing protein 2-like [Plakobranchus ocellatus]
MRTVSFVDRIELEFHGNVITQTMVLEDIDNDMGNELIVGNIDGDISIFKGESPNAWKKATISGMLTCLAVGKVHIPKKNSLVCMTAEGWCYMFDVSSKTSAQSVSAAEDDSDSRLLKPVFSQELPANAKVMCLADIDSDDHIEMVIGYSDRVVRAFRWHETPNSDTGQFVLLQKWQLAGQIGSITINYNHDHQPQLMVSQPGATFVTLQVKPAFRHIKSDSYLDRLCGSGSNVKSTLERSESFASVGGRGVDSSCGEYQQPSSRNHSPRGQQSSSVRKSELCASKSDILSTSTTPVSAMPVDPFLSQGDQLLKTYKETMKMMERHSVSRDKPEASSRLCKSESFCDQVDKLTTEGESNTEQDRTSGNSGARLPLTLKSSMEGLESDPLMGSGAQGSPHRSNTPTSSPKGSQESILERSLGCINNILDGSFDDDVFKPSIIYHPLALMQMRNKDTSTVIVGGINRGRPSQSGNGVEEAKPGATYYALATLDGSLLLVENDSILWSLQVDNYLFALSKLDVTGNGKEEVVCCSWNGQTYIVNHSKEIVRYQFPDSVAAFCAGSFSLRDGCNTPCFVYATFNNRIYVYPNIALPRVESTNLLNVMGRLPESRELLGKLNIAEDDVDSIRRLYHYCLYGQPGKK